jgi:hypothetical protein
MNLRYLCLFKNAIISYCSVITFVDCLINPKQPAYLFYLTVMYFELYRVGKGLFWTR